MQLSEITKSIVTFCTLVISVGTPILNMDLHWLPQGVANTISLVVAAAGLVVHYLAPNTTTNPTVAAEQSVRLRKPRAGRVKHVTHPSA